MHSVGMPKISPEYMYSEAYKGIRDSALRNRHERESSRIANATANFDVTARGLQYGTLAPANFSPAAVSVEEMRKLYRNRVTKEGTPGRVLYDQIRMGAPHGRCPYCGERQVESLDHYLPQSKFALLSVCPTNLVPCCSDCNRFKGEYIPSNNNAAVLHPYFDDAEAFRWLYADVIPGMPPAVKFRVDVTAIPDSVMATRLEAHFRIFQLAKLYASHAGRHIRVLERKVADIYTTQGTDGVRAHLLEEAEYQAVDNCNTWQIALYRGLAESEWYCAEYPAQIALSKHEK